MVEKNRSVPVRGLFVWLFLLSLSVIASAQAPSHFRYVIPKFVVTSGSELVLNNLSGQSVSAEVSLRGANGTLLHDSFVFVPGGSQTRLDPSSFTAAGDTLVVDSSAPLSAMGTFGDAG